MPQTRAFSDYEGLEILYTHLAQLDAVFGLFILSIIDQVCTPHRIQRSSLVLVATCRARTLTYTDLDLEVFWKVKMFIDVLS